MKQQFFVGDKVRICGTPQDDTHTSMTWNSDMTIHCGSVGVVEQELDYRDGGIGYYVKFGNGIKWAFASEWLTIVERQWQKNTGEQPVDDVEVLVKRPDGTVDRAEACMFDWYAGDIGSIVEWRIADGLSSNVEQPEAIPPSHVALGGNLVQVGEPYMKIWCDTCQGTGEIDQTLGGESFSSRHTHCPDCDGKGWWERVIAASVDNVRAQQDLVNSPKHYAFFDGVEAIEIIASSMSVEAFRGYCMGCNLKYRLRAGKKDDLQQDISKAEKYKELFENYKHLCQVK